MSLPSVKHLTQLFGDDPEVEVVHDEEGTWAFGTSRTFDAVLCLSVLHHIPDYLSAVNRFVEITRPGGAFVSWEDPRGTRVRRSRNASRRKPRTTHGALGPCGFTLDGGCVASRPCHVGSEACSIRATLLTWSSTTSCARVSTKRHSGRCSRAAMKASRPSRTGRRNRYGGNRGANVAATCRASASLQPAGCKTLCRRELRPREVGVP